MTQLIEDRDTTRAFCKMKAKLTKCIAVRY